jgi:hypothetical protein
MATTRNEAVSDVELLIRSTLGERALKVIRMAVSD